VILNQVISVSSTFINQLLHWADQFSYVSVLRSNPDGDYTYPGGTHYDQLIAIDAEFVLNCKAGNAFEKLDQFCRKHTGKWLFGHLSYDLKQETEHIRSSHPEKIGFEDLSFFVPKHVFVQQNGNWYYNGVESFETILASIESFKTPKIDHKPVELQPLITQEVYLKQVAQMQWHIQRGDIYEANFCQAFVGVNKEFNPLEVFDALMKKAPTPFAAFYKNNSSYLLSASPERFIQKKADELISQPIKGTAKRGKSKEDDLQIARALKSNPKEQAENVMIVDLVRNDLSHYAQRGSVTVPELFGTYQFPQVHQLISTVSCKLKSESDFIPALKAAFPMGSMTGAPKRRAMEIIEELESFKRGLFSGSVGYISPEGDADFNVVIRSILHNAETGTVMCPVGGAITIQATPEEEYAESLLKAEAIIQLLKG